MGRLLSRLSPRLSEPRARPSSPLLQRLLSPRKHAVGWRCLRSHLHWTSVLQKNFACLQMLGAGPPVEPARPPTRPLAPLPLTPPTKPPSPPSHNLATRCAPSLPAATDGGGAAGGHGGGLGARRRHHLFSAQPQLHEDQGQGAQRALHLPVSACGHILPAAKRGRACWVGREASECLRAAPCLLLCEAAAEDREGGQFVRVATVRALTARPLGRGRCEGEEPWAGSVPVPPLPTCSAGTTAV